MKKAYILHGCSDRDEYFSMRRPSPSNAHWIPWLQKQLLTKGYLAQTPEMPAPYAPDYDAWKSIMDAHTVDEDTIIIAHSCGAGFFLKWLSKREHRVDKLILVAPLLDLERYFGSFLQSRLKPDLMGRIHQLHILYSTDEPVGGVKETVDFLIESYPAAQYHEFDDKRHFCYEQMDEGGAFPELLAIALRP